MYLIKDQIRRSGQILFIFLLCYLISTGCQPVGQASENDWQMEFELMERGASYIEKKDYKNAYIIFSQFINKFSDHPYVDDAAYRIAYMHIIADEQNPYYDYRKALELFQNFIENYPNSRYISACQNWSQLLRKVFPDQVQKQTSFVDRTADRTELNQLREQLQSLEEENFRLRETLKELQEAIER